MSDLSVYMGYNVLFHQTTFSTSFQLVPTNFERVLSVLWSTTLASLTQILRQGIQRRRAVSFFQCLNDTFQVLLNFFFGDRVPYDVDIIYIKRLLKLYSRQFETPSFCYSQLKRF